MVGDPLTPTLTQMNRAKYVTYISTSSVPGLSKVPVGTAYAPTAANTTSVLQRVCESGFISTVFPSLCIYSFEECKRETMPIKLKFRAIQLYLFILLSLRYSSDFSTGTYPTLPQMRRKRSFKISDPHTFTFNTTNKGTGTYKSKLSKLSLQV